MKSATIEVDRPVIPVLATLQEMGELLQLSHRSRKSDDTVQAIIDLIRSRQYMPGDPLPGERQLARDLAVSRTSIREALRRLEATGLVEIQQGVGTFVKVPSSEVLEAALIPTLMIDRDTQQKLFELREIIEVEAAVRAAKRITPSQLSQMEHWLNEMEIKALRGDLKSAVFADVEFHRLIIEATGNDILTRLVDNLTYLLRELRLSTGMFAELMSQTIADHRSILDSLRSGDSQAAKRAMQEHLNHVKERTHLINEDGRLTPPE